MNAWSIYAFSDEAAQDLSGQIAALEKNGLSGMEIRNVDGKNIADLSLQEVRQIGERLKTEGLKVWSIGSPIGKISITEKPAHHEEQFKRLLDKAAFLNTNVMRIFSYYLPEKSDPSIYRDDVLERLDRLIHLSEGSGITLCHENEKGIYGDSAARCLELLKALPSLQAVFDPANFIQCGQDVLEAWALLCSRVRYLHVKDALEDGTVVPAGKGIGNLAFLIRDYLKRGGTALTLEPHLKIFSGFEKLEKHADHHDTMNNVYPDQLSAFAAASNALKSILQEIETEEKKQ